jgi:hypothetical protein
VASPGNENNKVKVEAKVKKKGVVEKLFLMSP